MELIKIYQWFIMISEETEEKDGKEFLKKMKEYMNGITFSINPEDKRN